MKKLDEFAIIHKLTQRGRAAAHNEGIEVGVGDDAAVVSISEGMRLVMSCDTMVETVHFDRWTMLPEHIGFKAMAINVSDIAAMGGIPKFALVSLSMPKKISFKKLEQLYKGLYQCADRYGIDVIGGDTTSSPRHLVLSVALFGEVEAGQALRRSAAEPGQAVFITGILGEAAAGFHLLSKQRSIRPSMNNHPYQRLIDAHQQPLPSVQAGRILLESGACGALNDVSDGLASELHEISEASGWSLTIDERLLPCSPELESYAATVGVHPLDWILFGGENFHLVGTAKRSKLAELQQLFDKADIPFYVIGEVSDARTTAGEVWLRSLAGELKRVEKKGYHHF